MKVKYATNKDFMNNEFVNIEWFKYAEDEDGEFAKTYKGFKYFSIDNIVECHSHIKFIMIYVDEFAPQNIVGVLKYGKYGSHIGLNYVDVREDYKYKGIGKKLLNLFNDLSFDEDVHCSFFSEECLNKGFHKTVFEALNKHDVCYDHRGFILKGTTTFVNMDKETIIKNPWTI